MTLQHFFERLYPKALSLKVDDVEVDSGFVFHLSSRTRRSVCPYCREASRSIHSRYQRSLSDLPCITHGTSIRVTVRRFRCRNVACSKQTFAERFEGLLVPYARYTNRLSKLFRQVGLKVGGEPGAKLLKAFSLTVSPDKLLKCMHDLKLAEQDCPKRIGIDDFAFRKGLTYGTLVVDLEQGKPVELLPSRDVDVVVNWLEQQPHLELVARDRSKEYALAISKGAPQVTQVLDRWHVLKNLREALEKDIGRHYADIKLVFEAKGLLGKPIPRSKREREAQALVLKKRQEQYKQVHALNQQGVTIVQMCKRLGLSRPLVYSYLRASEVPTAKRNKRQKSSLDKFRPQLETRFREGRLTIKEVWRELGTMGYAGSYQPVRRWFFERRQLPDKLMGLRISPRHFSSLFVKDEAKLSDKEKLILSTLDTVSELRQLRTEAVRFRTALLEKEPDKMKAWLDSMTAAPFVSVRNFAVGLQREWAELKAACSSKYSNGPTEGAVNRLKLIKRQMYGRGSFELLRKRVLLT
jgi:transposase